MALQKTVSMIDKIGRFVRKNYFHLTTSTKPTTRHLCFFIPKNKFFKYIFGVPHLATFISSLTPSNIW
jgi:hypothetical protein